MRRWIWIALLVAAVTAAVLVYVNQPGVPVDVAVAKRGTVRVAVEERAKTRLPDVYRITMPLAGRIKPIALRVGDRVQKGKPVAHMDSADLQTDVSNATAQVNQYEFLMQSMAKVVLSSKAQRDARKERAAWADKEFRRQRAGFEKGAVTPSELAAAELQKLESAYDYKKEEFTVQAMDAIVEAIKIARQDAQTTQGQKERDLHRAVIKSPVSGTVLKRYVSNERTLPSGETLLEVGDLDRLEIEADILTQDAVGIRGGEYGNEVAVEGAAIGPRPVRGKVWKVYPQGFRKISSLGVEQQRVKVIIRFDEGVLAKLQSAGRRLGTDYRVRVKIFLEQSTDAITIPRSAVFRDADGRWQAFVVRDGFARRVDLKVGLMNDFDVEVLDGVRVGDRVIVAPESNLEDGTKVAAD